MRSNSNMPKAHAARVHGGREAFDLDPLHATVERHARLRLHRRRDDLAAVPAADNTNVIAGANSGIAGDRDARLADSQARHLPRARSVRSGTPRRAHRS